MDVIKVNENFYNIKVLGKCFGTISRNNGMWVLDIPKLGINENSQYRNDLIEGAERAIRESKVDNEMDEKKAYVVTSGEYSDYN